MLMRILMLMARSSAWSPASLFAAGEQGVWYDPSDFSTMFQDAAGATPVTAVEQPVGLMLDKSKGLVLGPELVIAPYSGTAFGGFSSTGDSLVRNGGDSRFSLTINSPVIIGRFYKVTFNVSGFSGDDLIVRVGSTDGAVSRLSGNGQKSLIISAIGGSSILYFAGVSTNIGTATITNISIRELAGNHATQATVSKRPILKIDGNGKYYLKFDGIDDAMQTGNINFTITDKMTVVAGVRKLSDAMRGVVAELSSSTANTGVFVMDAPNVLLQNYSFASKSNTIISVAQSWTGSFVAPITNVLTGIGNISGDQAILRVNGAQAATSAADQGTGNYGNYPLYIGGRGGTSLPFNGHIYSLIVRGAQSSEAQILSAETYCNQKTGAY